LLSRNLLGRFVWKLGSGFQDNEDRRASESSLVFARLTPVRVELSLWARTGKALVLVIVSGNANVQERVQKRVLTRRAKAD